MSIAVKYIDIHVHIESIIFDGWTFYVMVVLGSYQKFKNLSKIEHIINFGQSADAIPVSQRKPFLVNISLSLSSLILSNETILRWLHYS